MEIQTLKIAPALLLFASLSACKPSLPEATDADIVKLVGGGGFLSMSNDQTRISKGTEECARALSGLDDELFKDAGPEMLGMLKTDCRQRFQTMISDPKRNPLGFELAHFESPELAERIANIRAAQLAEEQAEKERLAAEKIGQVKAEIASAQKEATDMLANLDEWGARFRKSCDAWEMLRKKMTDLKMIPEKSSDGLRPQLCGKNAWSQARENIETNAAKVLAYKYRDGFNMIPRLGYHTPTRLQEQLDKISEATARMTAQIDASQ